ncbi:trigger factor [Caldicoprobacter guelmensis]|uniref:trigger factor n=1 Tax=Caldicoprobacter guelmensis TaxID=1170224 RepID=UPI0019581C2A|nr:trigger factor [Caldicoprobacter guelmensis]
MKATAEKIENNKVKLKFQVDAQEFEKALDKSYVKNKGKFIIPGFRKGKAPRKLIERYYGEGVFYEDAFNEIFSDVYWRAVEENGLEPVDYPTVEEIEQIGSGKDLVFTASVIVKPEVELGQYKGIEVEKVEYNVTDKDVEDTLKRVQERYARWVAVEGRPIKEGDMVTLDYQGFVDGQPIEDGSAQNYTLEIGSRSFIPGFEEQLIGLSAGDEKEIKVTFPEDYGVESLKGKEAVFKVKIHDIKEKELPALDDEFAKEVSDFETIEEYRAHLKEDLERIARNRAREQMEDQLLSQVVEAAKVDIPDVMVEREIDIMLGNFEIGLYYRGLTLKRYLELTGISKEDLRAQYRQEAYTRVKTGLVLEKIARVEGIEVTQEDLDKELEELANQFNITVDEAKERFAESVERRKDEILVKKTIDFLMDNAVIVDKAQKTQQDDQQGDVKAENGNESTSQQAVKDTTAE